MELLEGTVIVNLMDFGDVYIAECADCTVVVFLNCLGLCLTKDIKRKK